MESKSRREFLPAQLFRASLVITVFFALILAVQIWFFIFLAEDVHLKQHRLKENIGQILFLDEALTMSARMAVVTGNLKYVDRYNQLDPQLDTLIKSTIRLMPTPAARKYLGETDISNQALVKMERGAIELARRGERADALKFIEGADYARLKDSFLQGVRGVQKMVGLEEQKSVLQEKVYQNLLFFESFAGLGLLVMLWIFQVRTAGRWLEERKREGDLLRESEERFKSIAENSPNMIFVNRRGQVIYANRLCEDTMGYSREEFLSPQFNFLSLISPESQELIRVNFGRHLKGEDLPPYEYRLVTKAGKKIEAIITTKLIAYGGEKAILGIVTDISDRKRMEESLRESEEKYKTLAEKSFEGIMIMRGLPPRIVYANPAMTQLLGYSTEELTSFSFESLQSVAHPDDREMLWSRFRDRMESKFVTPHYQFRAVRKNGEIVVLEMSATRIEYKGAPAVLATFIDVTEESKVEEIKKTLVRNIAHKLKTPLAVVEMAIQMLERSAGEKEKTEKAMTMIRKNMTDLHFDIDAILKGYALGGGGGMAKEKISLKPIVDEVFEHLAPLIKSKNLEVEVAVPADLCEVYGNEGELRLLLHNLIENAVKYTGAGIIRVRGGVEGNKVKVIITDTGRGLTEEDKKLLFTFFYQSSPAGGGMGLGLVISREIVERLKGQIAVESEGVGRGTTVTVTLPKGDVELGGVEPPSGKAVA